MILLSFGLVSPVVLFMTRVIHIYLNQYTDCVRILLSVWLFSLWFYFILLGICYDASLVSLLSCGLKKCNSEGGCHLLVSCASDM